jgi:hypothetical protein
VVKLNINILYNNLDYIIYSFGSPLKMQLLPPQPTHYLPLLALVPLTFSGSSVAHLSLVGLQVLLRPSTTQNYCNAALSVMLTPLLLLLNL